MTHHTDYFHTLKVYLDHHMNAVQTAKELYIHRSTFLYRLDKIKQALCSDLDDPDGSLSDALLSFIEMEKDNASPLTLRREGVVPGSFFSPHYSNRKQAVYEIF
ncbi:MAG: helix-turn-helix domain-containing protein [Blautia sp.]